MDPEISGVGYPKFTVDEIKKMSMEDYARYRHILLGQVNQQMTFKPWTTIKNEIDAGLLSCYYCGLECASVEERDEHEENCE
jgi:ABC-type lipoprotein export system ATPase subunit